MNLLVHAELSWLLGHRSATRRQRVLVTCAGVLPDLDGLSLIGGADLYARYHHLLLHSWLGALITTIGVWALSARSVRTALLACAAFHLHLLCDLLGSGPDWPLWYFFPPSRTEAPLSLSKGGSGAASGTWPRGRTW